MTSPILISFAEGQRSLDWLGLTDAFEAGHRSPRAEIADTFLYRGDDTLLSRAAWIDSMRLAVKSATIFPGNAVHGLPGVKGAVCLFSDRDGGLEACIDFHLVTKWKTAGDSLLAARKVARLDSHDILIIGAGIVAGNHSFRRAGGRRSGACGVACRYHQLCHHGDAACAARGMAAVGSACRFDRRVSPGHARSERYRPDPGTGLCRQSRNGFGSYRRVEDPTGARRHPAGPCVGGLLRPRILLPRSAGHHPVQERRRTSGSYGQPLHSGSMAPELKWKDCADPAAPQAGQAAAMTGAGRSRVDGCDAPTSTSTHQSALDPSIRSSSRPPRQMPGTCPQR